MDLARAIAAAFGPLYLTTRAQFVERRMAVPGIGAAAAYASGDTFGALFEIPNVAREIGGTGTLMVVRFYDLDNEGLAKTLHLFRAPVTPAADNAAHALSDADALQWIGKVDISLSVSATNNYQFLAQPVLPLKCAPTTTSIWGLLVTNGADNIAAKSEPYVETFVAWD